MRRFDPKKVIKQLTEPRRFSDADLRRQQLEPITRGLSSKAKQRVCQQHASALLNEWEQTFIYGLDRRHWHREYLSVLQTNKLNEIYDRLVFENGVHYRATYGE
jgi:hypothetical protein